MKNKIIALTIVFLLSFVSLSVATGEENISENVTISKSVLFSTASFEEQGEFLKITLDECDTYTSAPGEPMMPVITRTFTFPHGTKIKNVEVKTTGLSQEKIDAKILPAPKPVPRSSLNIEKEDTQDIDFDIYSSSEPYPEKEFEYKITSGIDDLYLSIRIYPCRYIPSEDTLLSVDEVDIDISYEKNSYSATFDEEYDMVIIAPDEFNNTLGCLVDHKNDIEVKTFLKTTEEIYDEYPGRDEPEQIKYFIKDALETYNISYVLLVGGMKGWQKEWYLPVRMTNVDDYWETSTISDLYYADIYKYNETSMEKEFEDWDNNSNDVFAEWFDDYRYRRHMPDDVIEEIDLVPDVALGRLACRSLTEVRTIVDKIITYETMTKLPFWYKKMLAIAGDTFPNSEDDYEGEIETTASSDLMEGFGYTIQKLYASVGTLRTKNDVMRTMRSGAGFVHFSGHGNPKEWATHPANNYDRWIIGLNTVRIPFILNGNRLPVVVVGGCHNSQFNVTPLNLIYGIVEDSDGYFSADSSHPGGFLRFEWIPECWSWKLLSTKNGGAIAVIGNTGLGYGTVGSGITGLGGWIEVRFFELIANQDKTTVGMAHAQAITDYVNIIGGVNSDMADRKTVDGWALLGDPSLQIEE